MFVHSDKTKRIAKQLADGSRRHHQIGQAGRYPDIINNTNVQSSVGDIPKAFLNSTGTRLSMVKYKYVPVTVTAVDKATFAVFLYGKILVRWW